MHEGLINKENYNSIGKFIGRQEESEIFKKIFSSSLGEKWILNLYADGGMGKTQLLLHYLKLAKEFQNDQSRVLMTSGLVDLYWTKNKTRLGILQSIAVLLANPRTPSIFQNFQHFLEGYNKEHSPKKKGGRFYSLKGKHILKPDNYITEGIVEEQFFKDYKDLDADRILIFFDTVDKDKLGPAFLKNLTEVMLELKKYNPKTRIIIAGREKLEGYLPSKLIEYHELKGFSHNDIKEYFQKRNIGISESSIKHLRVLSDGNPLLVALSVDWINSGHIFQDLMDCTSKKQFKKNMVERIWRLRFKEDRIILAMAYFERRCDEDILSNILNKPKREILNLVNSLQHSSFVKFRALKDSNVMSCLLHDEMSRLINDYVWSSLDPARDYRKEWNRKIIKYYERIILKEDSAVERNSLKQERLFYWFKDDVDKAFQYYEEIFEEALSAEDSDWAQAINDEVRKFRKKLSPLMVNILKAQEARVLKSQSNFPRAFQEMELAFSKKLPIDLEASVRIDLVELYANQGSPAQAIELGIDSDEWFEEKLQETSFHNQQERDNLKRKLISLDNTLGFTYRSQNNFIDAIRYYEKALEHADKEKLYNEKAKILNNLSYAHLRLGQFPKAHARAMESIELKKRLEKYQGLGFSYNVLGLIRLEQGRMGEAVSSFEEALAAFEKTNNAHGQALVYVAYGRALRQFGWYKEKFVEKEHDPQREEYLSASEMFIKAIKFFRKNGDLANLSEVLNENGTLLRQQQDFTKAVKHYTESLHLSEKLNNIHRQADNLQDLGITYYLMAKHDKAIKNSQKACELAETINNNYFQARAQRTIATIEFENENFKKAFEAAGKVCTKIVQPDPKKYMDAPAKRELMFDEIVDWLCGMILALPSKDGAEYYAKYLADCWKEENIGGRSLDDLFPGFIERVRNTAKDFEFLRADSQGER